MIQNEAVFQNMVINLFTALGGHATNVEPRATNPGMPDINWCLQGIEGNLELKFMRYYEAAPQIRPYQITWFRERVRAGGYPMFSYYIEDGEDDTVIIVQGRYYEELAKAGDVKDILEVPHLEIMPRTFVEGLISYMSDWHDEVDPLSRIQLLS